jgi:hypothetical protein
LLFHFCWSFFVLSLLSVASLLVWLSLLVASGLEAETWFAGWCLSLAFTHCSAVFFFFSWSCEQYYDSLKNHG